jgi:hypothetical protein
MAIRIGPHTGVPVHRDAGELVGAARDDVDDRELGIASIDRRAGPANDLDPLDLIDREVIAELIRRVQRLVHLLAVDQQQHLAFVAPVAAHADPDDTFDIDAERDARHEHQHVLELARAGVHDLLARDHRDDARNLAVLLRHLRRDVDIGAEQLFERELGDVFDLVVGPRGSCKAHPCTDPEKGPLRHPTPSYRNLRSTSDSDGCSNRQGWSVTSPSIPIWT